MNDTTDTNCTCPSGNGSLRHPCPAHIDQRAAGNPAAAQEAVAIDADVFHAMNGELCDFAIRWKLDGDYLRCTGCKRPQLTNYAGEAFIHAGGCKHADTSEVHPWLALRRIMRPMFAPVAAAPVDSDAFDYLVDEVAAEHGEMLDDGGPSGWSFTCEDLAAFAKHLMNDYKGALVADAYAIARAEAKRDSAPAAPGIDLEQFRDCVTTTRAIALQTMSNALNRGAESAAADARRDIDECDRLLAQIDASPKGGAFDMAEHLRRQREWSERTFGPGTRAAGIVDHIRKELLEIEADPGDLREWIDVAILALDGAWRSGATPQQIIDALVAKQVKNEGRVWPDWRAMPADKAIEHDRSADSPKGGSDKAEAYALMAAEYQRWLDFFHAGNGDFNDFLRKELPEERMQATSAEVGE